jgi:hypothetical protein
MNWTGQVTSSDQGLIIDDETGLNIAVAYDPGHTNLIAAAPDLLNAVRFLLSNHDNRISKPDRDAAYAAIAKAKGETA